MGLEYMKKKKKEKKKRKKVGKSKFYFVKFVWHFDYRENCNKFMVLKISKIKKTKKGTCYWFYGLTRVEPVVKWMKSYRILFN